MNRLSTAKRIQVIAALVEGNSINARCRMPGVGKHTVLRPLEDAGCACAAYHHSHVQPSAKVDREVILKALEKPN